MIVAIILGNQESAHFYPSGWHKGWHKTQPCFC